MQRIELATPAALSTTHAGGAVVPSDHLVALVVEPDGLAIHTGHFHSRDVRGEREGVLTVRVCGQETVFPFTGRGVVQPRFRERLLYLGGVPHALDLDVQVLELDRQARERLATAADVAEQLAKTPLGGSHPALAPGLGLVAGLLRFAGSRVDDDEEARLFWVHERPLRADEVLRLELPARTTGKPRLVIDFRVLDLGPVQRFSQLAVRIARPVLELDESARLPVRRPASRGGARRPETRQVGAQSWLGRMERFNFEARSGSAAAAYSAPLRTLGQVLSWHERELFVARAGRAAERHVLPLRLGFSLNTKALDAEALLGLAGRALDVAAVWEPRAGAVRSWLTKQGPSLLGLLSDLAPAAFTLYALDGVVVLDPEGGATLADGPGRLVLRSPDGVRWARRVETELAREGVTLGRFGFDLAIVRVDPPS